ncbi:MAG: hopanoid biosynthesis-associated protein HpnK [Verrucomicrobia bacterium]|nr:hopanoid biosynthesis-associated protein HpnK [Verrucomicrobiota bacterium]
MACLDAARRLIVNADDFGRSRSINAAVIRAHREGILTTASLMVNGAAADEAVELARQHPRLGVGLHLTLVCGRSTLKPTQIPGLVDNHHHFSNRPVLAALRYFLDRALRHQLRHEIDAQVRKFGTTGLPLDHLNGHLHLHLHPTVFSLLRHHAADWKLSRMRLTRDRFWLNARLASGRWLYRISHAVIFTWLAARSRPALNQLGVQHPRVVFGLLQDGRVDERYVLNLLPHLPGGDSELYSHPSLDESRTEFEALISPRVKGLIDRLGIQLIRYQDL